MTASYRILNRWSSLLLYKENKEKYVASCELTYRGDVATIYSLKGEEFYSLLLELNFQPFKDLGIKYVIVAMSKGHVRLISSKLKGIANIKDIREIYVDGHKLREVEISLIE